MSRCLPTKEITLRTSGLAEITSDWSSTKRINQGYSRIAVLINVSAITDSPSVVATIEAYDRVSNTYMAVAKSAAITGTGAYILTLGPGQNETDDVDSAPVISSVNGFLPRQWRLTMDGTWGGTDGMTFTASAVLSA